MARQRGRSRRHLGHDDDDHPGPIAVVSGRSRCIVSWVLVPYGTVLWRVFSFFFRFMFSLYVYDSHNVFFKNTKVHVTNILNFFYIYGLFSRTTGLVCTSVNGYLHQVHNLAAKSGLNQQAAKLAALVQQFRTVNLIRIWKQLKCMRRDETSIDMAAAHPQQFLTSALGRSRTQPLSVATCKSSNLLILACHPQ